MVVLPTTEIIEPFFLYYSSILEECDIIMYIMYEEALWGTNIEITMDMGRRIRALQYYWCYLLSVLS